METFLILINIALIDLIQWLPFSVVVGSLISLIAESKRRLVLLFSVVIILIIRLLILLFISTISDWIYVIVSIGVLWLVYVLIRYYQLSKEKSYSNSVFSIVFMPILFLIFIEDPMVFDYYIAIAFTSNMNIIIASFFIGNIIIYGIIHCYLIIERKYSIIKSLGFIVLLLIIIRSVFYFSQIRFDFNIYSDYIKMTISLIAFLIIVVSITYSIYRKYKRSI